MLVNESSFRLISIGFLSAIFIGVTALADKEQKPVEQSIFSTVEHIEEAERINNNQMHVLNLTSIGERVELISPTQKKSK